MDAERKVKLFMSLIWQSISGGGFKRELGVEREKERENNNRLYLWKAFKASVQQPIVSWE